MEKNGLAAFACPRFLALAGLLSLASTNAAFFWQQLVWVSAGLAAIFALSQIDLRPFLTARWFYLGFFGAAILLLVATYFSPRPFAEREVG